MISYRSALESKREMSSWVGIYKNTFSVDKNMIALVRRLRRRYIVAWLSNVDFSRYRFSTKYLHPELSEYRFASCHLKLRKPEQGNIPVRARRDGARRMKVHVHRQYGSQCRRCGKRWAVCPRNTLCRVREAEEEPFEARHLI